MTTIRHLPRLLRAEWIKSRRQPLRWLVLALPLLVAAIQVLIQYRLAGQLTQPATETPWPAFLLSTFNLLNFMLLPLAVIILASQLMQVEFRAVAWKQLFILPQHPAGILLSKYVFLLLLVGAIHLLISLLAPLSGLLLGTLRPQLGYLDYSLPWPLLGSLLWRSGVAILAILAIQLFLAWWFANYTIPIVFGVAATAVFSTAGIAWDKGVYIPYAYPSLQIMDAKGMLNPPLWGQVPVFFWLSILFFLLVLILQLTSIRYRLSGR